MAIKKRGSKSSKFYAEFRREQWEKQPPYEDFDFHKSRMADGSPLTEPALNPKKVLWFKDTWHCPSAAEARRMARLILSFPDVTALDLKGTWFWVDYNASQSKELSHVLDGQPTDDRKRYRGGKN